MKIQNLKQTMFLCKILVAGAVVGLQAVPAFAGDPPPPPAPGHSTAYGKSLAEWQELFWRWAFGQIAIPADENGNATVRGNVVLLPGPPTPGDGTPGTSDVTLNAGQAIMLPMWNILGTTYDDGSPVDPALDLSVFQTLEIRLKIDGVTVVDSNNVLNYYSAFAFDPEIPLPPEWSPYLAIVWFQGIGILQSPLSVGQHIITLDAKNTIPVVDGKGNSYVFEYHNTWNVTVKPRK